MPSKQYASTKDPDIAAVLQGTAGFSEASQALARLRALRERFITSRLPREDGDLAVRLWIRGYAITESEARRGFVGNYAVLTSTRAEGGRYMIAATKIEVDLDRHPGRRKRQRFPHWEHPTLRDARQRRLYPSIVQARQALQRLQQGYPQASRLVHQDKLALRVYGRPAGEQRTLHQYVLTVTKAEAGYFLRCEENPDDRRERAQVVVQADVAAVPRRGWLRAWIQKARRLFRRDVP